MKKNVIIGLHGVTTIKRINSQINFMSLTNRGSLDLVIYLVYK